METKKMWSIGCLSMVVIMFIGLIWLFATDEGDTDLETKIEQKISQHDFDEAREIAQNLSDIDNKRKKMLKQINKSQLSVFINDNNWEDAKNLANELNAIPEYQELFGQNVDKLLAQERYDIVMNTLTLWTFKGVFYDKEEYKEGYRDYSFNNNKYNSEVSAYNLILDKLINYCIDYRNVDIIKRSIRLYKPIAVEVSKTVKEGKTTATWTLKNNALQRARKRVADAGINL